MKRVISLFSGIGGIDLAFQQAGFDIVWANDIDHDACTAYRANFKKTPVIEGDIRKVHIDNIPDAEVIAAGFPCQSFSVCGNRKGFSDERGNLFFDIMRITDKVKPEIIFLENVANLVEHDKGRTFNTIFIELAKRGYFIRYLVADACDYGIPQHRTRTYIVAFRDEHKCEQLTFPEKTELKTTVFDVIDRSSRVADKYNLDPETDQYKRLSAFIKDRDQIYRFSDYGIQSGKDGISFTLKANMGTWYNRVPIIYDNFGLRTITPYECLALQGFPKWFVFPDIPEKSQYKQCGNTVVVSLVRRIAENIKTALEYE